MKDYRRIKTSSGNVYYMEMSEEEIREKDKAWLAAAVPVLTLAFVYGCAIAAGLIKIF